MKLYWVVLTTVLNLIQIALLSKLLEKQFRGFWTRLRPVTDFVDTAWDVSNVYAFDSLFSNCPLFDNGGNPDNIGLWNLRNTPAPAGELYSFGSMFNGCSSFNGDVSPWDVSNVRKFESMFNGCSSFNQDLSQWDFSGLAIGSCNSASIIYFLRGATAFNQDISNWDLTGAGGLNGLMGPNFPPSPLPSDPTLDTSIYNNVLVNWSALGNYSRAANCSFWSSGGTNFFVFGKLEAYGVDTDDIPKK